MAITKCRIVCTPVTWVIGPGPFVSYFTPTHMNKEAPMLAEIFIIRLETKRQEKKQEGNETTTTASTSRFVPVTLPVVKTS